MNLAKHISDTELSAKILRHAVPKMSELSIPVTPDNYAVWYEYYKGINLDLTRAIDKLIANNIRFTSDVNAGLYRRHIQEHSPEVIENVQLETQIIINSLLAKVSKMTNGTESFSKVVSKVQNSLTTKLDADRLNVLIEQLDSEISQVLADNDKLVGSLSNMKSEVSSLKSEMASLQQVALTDQLTSLYNRRAFDAEVIKHMKEFSAEQVPSSLLMIDIDLFKQFNDTYGHAVGDKVLAYVALTLKRAVRGTDFVARYGGEEFVILMPDTDINGAITVAESIREKISKQSLSIGQDNKQELGSITVSIGVSTLNISDDNESYFVRADESLYRAKSNGRNCVMSELS